MSRLRLVNADVSFGCLMLHQSIHLYLCCLIVRAVNDGNSLPLVAHVQLRLTHILSGMLLWAMLR